MLRISTWCRVLAACALVACDAERDAPDPVAPGWDREVAPLLAARCGGCHRPGGIGPHAFDRYEDAAPRADALAFMTRTRQMPPWTADQSGACNTFADTAWLSDEELDTLARWAAAGAPRGARATAVTSTSTAPTHVPAPRALRVDRTLIMPEPYRPQDAPEGDDHRCFPLATPGDGTFVTAFAMRPGVGAMVHHAVLFKVAAAARAQIDAHDARDAGPGYDCYGGGAVVPGATPVAAWTPGQPATFLPEGTGVRLGVGDRLILQVHYNTLHVPAPWPFDQSAVDLQLATSVPHEAIFLALSDDTLTLAPGQAQATSEVTRRPFDLGATEPITLFGVYPHMHLRGRAARVWLTETASDRSADVDPAVDASSQACLVDLPRWDFAWQRFWFFTAPIVMAPTDTLHLRCTFDTRDETAPLRAGFSTADEMCIAGFYAVRGAVPGAARPPGFLPLSPPATEASR